MLEKCAIGPGKNTGSVIGKLGGMREEISANKMRPLKKSLMFCIGILGNVSEGNTPATNSLQRVRTQTALWGWEERGGKRYLCL